MKRHPNSSSSRSVASDPSLPVLIAVDPLPEAPPSQPPFYRQIKLALDVHAGDLMVVRRTMMGPYFGMESDILMGQKRRVLNEGR